MYLYLFLLIYKEEHNSKALNKSLYLSIRTNSDAYFAHVYSRQNRGNSWCKEGGRVAFISEIYILHTKIISKGGGDGWGEGTALGQFAVGTVRRKKMKKKWKIPTEPNLT